MLDSTTRLLLVNGIKVQKGQKYELGETTPVEDVNGSLNLTPFGVNSAI